MNFLAHLYLSKNNSNILIGNFIADHLNGNKYDHFHPEIQKGIKLHRYIDSYTDAHEIVRVSKRRLHERYRHYDGVIIDIFYDYFLAKNWSKYSAIPLDVFSQGVYRLLDQNDAILPSKTKELLPYMKQYDWLTNYQYLNGIEHVLNGMNRRTKGKSQMHLAIKDLTLLSAEFEKDFTNFFEDLKLFSQKKLNELI